MATSTQQHGSRGDSTYDSELYYIYDGERHERGNAGDHIVLTFDGAGDLTNRYLYGRAVDQILAEEQVTTTTSSGDVIWPLGDNLNTIRDLAEYNSGTGETTVTNHRQFDSFGNITDETNSAVDHIFTFTARELDEEIGLYNLRTRILDAVVAQFASEDLIGFRGRDANLTRYVGNSPTTATDPSGLYEIEWEGNWTATQKQKILDALDAVKDRVEQLIKEIDDYLDRLSPCVRAELRGPLKLLKDVFKQVSAGIASESENLELYHDSLGEYDPWAETFPAGWYGVNGFYSDGQITFNDELQPESWETISPDELGKILFHELTHLYGTEDNDTEGLLNNANNIEKLWHNDMDQWDSLGNLRREAEQSCGHLREPQSYPTRPGFPDPFGFPWIF